MGIKNESLALAIEIGKSDAIKYEGRIKALQMSYYVFNRNFQELANLIGIRNDPRKIRELWALHNRPKLRAVMLEILRLFQNYLASAKSLVDQTRVIVRTWYRDSVFLEEYQKEINARFVKNPTAGFIEDLRNYSLHYSLPVSRAIFKLQPSNEEGEDASRFSFALSKDSLLKWKSWKKGKSFLSKADKEIDIGNLVDDYYEQITDFHSWLIKRLREIHQEDLKWLDETRTKAQGKMSKKELKERGWL